jgi:superfamily I DNA/RNA helicase
VFSTLEEEQEFLVSTARKLVEEFRPEEICLVARTNALRDKYAAALGNGKVRHLVLEKDTNEKDEGVRVATLHRVKGLEFRCMLLAGMSAGEIPHRAPSIKGDRTAEREHDARERSLVFVAATRARDRLIVTGAGVGSEYLR